MSMAEQKTRLTVAAYARHRKSAGLPGGSESAVRNAIKSGRIERGVDGLIDPAIADQEWLANTGRPGPKPTAAGTDYEQERARKMRADADKAELDLAERRGELVSAAKVREEGFTLGSAISQRILGIPHRIAPELASLDDPREITRFLEVELREALERLSAAED